MKHNNLIIMSALALVISLTGCGNTNKLSEYDMTGISFIEYTDIDTVCEDEELITAGSNLLSDQEDNLLLSYVVDSAIELSTELGDYDHLVFTNPKWIENFGDSGKLKPIEYSSLSKSMQEFLDSQMPIEMSSINCKFFLKIFSAYFTTNMHFHIYHICFCPTTPNPPVTAGFFL